MNTENKNRKKIMVDHQSFLKESLDRVMRSKQHIENNIKEGKKTLENLDKVEYEIKKESDLLQTLNFDEAYKLDGPTWYNYINRYENDKGLFSSLLDYENTLKDQSWTLTTSLSGNYAISSTTATGTIFQIFRNTPVETKDFASTAHKYITEKDPTEIIDLVYKDLTKIDKGKADEFQKIIRDYRVSDPEIRFSRLLDLRSLIFYQLFENFSPEAKYSKTNWYKKTKPKTIERSGRFCQTKYFILGNTSFIKLLPAGQRRIDFVCKKMKSIFDSLSQLGKTGSTLKQTQILFNETIGTFSEVLQLRATLYS
jgi:hypothetical protein